MQNDARHINAPLTATAKTGIWIALVVGASILFSLALACATPFAALAAAAGIKMQRRDALILVILAWLATQMIGYFVLGYPRTWDSFAWGAAIGIAAMLATVAASESKRLPNGVIAGLAAFLGAFIIYEGGLYATTALLPSGDEAFSLPIVARILEINALAFAGLLVLHRLATAIGLSAPRTADMAVGHRV